MLSVSVTSTYGHNFYQHLKSGRSISALSVIEIDHGVHSVFNSCSARDLHVGVK